MFNLFNKNGLLSWLTGKLKTLGNDGIQWLLGTFKNISGLRDLYDMANNSIEGFKGAVEGIRMEFPPKAIRLIERYGDMLIQDLWVCRTILRSFIRKAVRFVNQISLRDVPVEKLYHLFFLIKVPNKTLVYEKNEEIGLYDGNGVQIDEKIRVLVPSGLTLKTMISTTLSAVGEERYFHYSAFNHNCQDFVYSNMIANKIPVNESLKTFILQDVSDIVPKWARKLANTITDVANRADQVIEGVGH